MSNQLVSEVALKLRTAGIIFSSLKMRYTMQKCDVILLLWGFFLVIEFVSSASLLVVEYHLGMYSGDRAVYVKDAGNEVEWEVVCL